MATLLGLAGLVLVLDQWTKGWALAALRPGEVREVLGPLLGWTLVFNPGAAFSMGTGITPVFTVIMSVVVVAILLATARVGSRWWAVALGLLLGGALGNLHDRLLRPPGFARGHVIDFIALPNFPVFNVADSAITAAAALIALAALRDIPLRGRERGHE